jgi:hypothetical protein
MDLEDDAPPETIRPEDITVRPFEAFLTPPAPPSPSFLPSGNHPIVDVTFNSQLAPPSNRPPSAPPFLAQRTARPQAPTAARLARIESELHQARDDVEQKDLTIEALRAQVDALGIAIQATLPRDTGDLAPRREDADG